MILQRLIKATANQNWNTVLLEILIVVIGIFLGLQVDDWNERRKLRQQESMYLEKLVDDLTTMRTELADKVERHNKTIGRMTAAHFALEDCRISDETKSDISFTLERYQITPPFSYLSATYDDMVASGAFTRIEDHELKQQIAYSFSHLAGVNTYQQSFRISMPVVDEIVWRAVSYSIDRETGRPVASYEMSALCDNVELRNAVVEMIDIQHDSRGGAWRALGPVDELLENLEAKAVEGYR